MLVCAYLLAKTPTSAGAIKRLVMDALLVQSWSPHADDYFSYNGVAWYLSTYLFILILAPWVMKVLSKWKKQSNLIAGMNRMNAMCQGAPQQSANGTSTLSEIVEILVKKLDTEKKYSTTLSSIVMLKTRNNALCQGADQQSANYLYRTMEMIQLITNIMLDKMQKRIELYWQEHAEEKKALLAEKEEAEMILMDLMEQWEAAQQ